MMRNLLVFIAMSAGGWIGWAMGARFGMVVAMLLSLVGSAVALYFARRWVRDHL